MNRPAELLAAAALGAASMALALRLLQPSDSKDEGAASQDSVFSTSKPKIVLVTGGSGLVGRGIETFVATDAEASANEEWVFLSSKDGDLKSRADTEVLSPP